MQWAPEQGPGAQITESLRWIVRGGGDSSSASDERQDHQNDHCADGCVKNAGQQRLAGRKSEPGLRQKPGRDQRAQNADHDIADDAETAPTITTEAPKADPTPDAASEAAQSTRTPRAGTKQSALIAMLRAPDGATIEEVMAATGWQSHYADVRIMPR